MKPEYLYALLGAIILINMILVFKFAGKKSGGTGSTVSKDVHETYQDISREDKTEVVFEDEEEEASKPKAKPQEAVKEEKETVKEKPSEKVKAKEVTKPVIELEIPELSEDDKTEIEIEEDQDATMVEEEDLEDDVPIIATLSYLENGLEKTYEFATSPLKIGRDPKQCDLVISEDKFMGRCHGVITFEDSELYFEDLQSKNGSFINGKRIEGKIKIEAGMIIKLAHTEFKIKR
jgi:hypothetical protein